jgi:Na+-transporting methylmalonyl-CoA/oxaloacetate decarboxylase gamma subunit
MSEEIKQGLTVAAYGMGLVFATLVIFMVMVKGLLRLYPWRKPPEGEAEGK